MIEGLRNSWSDKLIKKWIRFVNLLRIHSFCLFLAFLTYCRGRIGGRSRDLFVERATMKLWVVMNVNSLYIFETCLLVWEFLAGWHVLQLQYWHWVHFYLFQCRYRLKNLQSCSVAPRSTSGRDTGAGLGRTWAPACPWPPWTPWSEAEWNWSISLRTQDLPFWTDSWPHKVTIWHTTRYSCWAGHSSSLS